MRGAGKKCINDQWIECLPDTALLFSTVMSTSCSSTVVSSEAKKADLQFTAQHRTATPVAQGWMRNTVHDHTKDWKQSVCTAILSADEKMCMQVRLYCAA